MGEITFSGLASGMDTSSWVKALVSIKQQSVTKLQKSRSTVETSSNVLSTIKSKVTTLRSSIEKFTDAKFGSSFDLFSKNKVTTSKDSVVTANVTADAAKQNFDVIVNKLATATKATSNLGSSALINGDTKFADLAGGKAKTGSLSLYVDGEKKEITIDEEDTVDDILNKIVDAGGTTRTSGSLSGGTWNPPTTTNNVNATVQDGKIVISGNNGKEVVLGASSDESNFVKVMGLVKDADTGSYESSSKISSVNTSSKIMEAFSGLKDGTFKIGNAEFTIDENTTIKGLISKINSSEDAGVSAYWDASQSELVLTSKTEGAFNINIEKGSSNFTDMFGFTETKNGVTKLKDQQLGDYAELTINGTTLISSSNTVTSEISGIEGLTLTLNSVSKADESGTINPSTVKVEQDSDALLDAAKSFVTAYNEAISNIDDNTSYGDALYGDSALTSLRTNLRRTATASIDDGTMKLLSDIGITTGKANNSTSTTGVNTLQIDEDKFKEALAKNPEAVKSLLVGDNKGTSTSGGVMNKLEKIVEDSLDVSTGYFDAKSKSLSSKIKSLENSITSAQSRVDAYQARLEKQFSNMEQIISSIQSSYSQLNI